MKEFRVEEWLPLPLEVFYHLFFADPAFTSRFLLSTGHSNVSVSEWMAESANTFKRVCFFCVRERNEKTGEILQSRCTETQRCVLLRKARSNPPSQQEGTEDAAGVERMVLDSNVVPDNPLGNCFRIQTKWEATPSPPPAHRDLSSLLSPQLHARYSLLSSWTRLAITGEVEFTKKMWGVTSMVESHLLQQTHTAHQKWLQLALQQTEAHWLSNPYFPREPPSEFTSPSLSPAQAILHNDSTSDSGAQQCLSPNTSEFLLSVAVDPPSPTGTTERDDLRMRTLKQTQGTDDNPRGDIESAPSYSSQMPQQQPGVPIQKLHPCRPHMASTGSVVLFSLFLGLLLLFYVLGVLFPLHNW